MRDEARQPTAPVPPPEPAGTRLQELLERAWEAAHGLAEDAEGEFQRLRERVVELSSAPRAEAERLLEEARQRFVENRREMERLLEEGVRAHLSRLKFPSREELGALQAYLDGLEARLASLERRRRAR